MAPPFDAITQIARGFRLQTELKGEFVPKKITRLPGKVIHRGENHFRLLIVGVVPQYSDKLRGESDATGEAHFKRKN
jgi:hypothetical protein